MAAHEVEKGRWPHYLATQLARGRGKEGGSSVSVCRFAKLRMLRSTMGAILAKV